MDYCNVCSKSLKSTDKNFMCRKCNKDYKICAGCGGIVHKREVEDAYCIMCREEKDAL